MLEENKAMVRRMVEGINAGDEDAVVDELDELFAPARRWGILPSPGDVTKFCRSGGAPLWQVHS